MSPKSHRKPSAKRPASVEDKRATLAALEEVARDSERRAEKLREEIAGGDGPEGRPLPTPGSQWRRHEAFIRHEFERELVWRFLFLAWDDFRSGSQLAVLESTIDADLYRKAIPLDRLLVEFVEADQ